MIQYVISADPASTVTPIVENGSLASVSEAAPTRKRAVTHIPSVYPEGIKP